MLRIVSPASRFTSTGLLGKVAASTHNTPHTSSVVSSVQCAVCWIWLFVVSGRRTFASTSARGADITLTVDGKEITVPQGFWVFRVYLALGGYKTDLVFLRFCVDPGLWGSRSDHTQVCLLLTTFLACSDSSRLDFAIMTGTTFVVVYNVCWILCAFERLAIAGNCRYEVFPVKRLILFFLNIFENL